MNTLHISTTLKTLTLTAALCAAGSASANLNVFTDPAAFAAATGDLQTENFNRFTSDLGATSGAPTFNFGDFMLKSGPWLIDAPSTQNTIDGSTNVLLSFPPGAFSEFNFANPITAFGFWYTGLRGDLSPDWVSRVNVAANSLNGFGSYTDLGDITLASGTTPRFIGVTANQPFNRIVFNGVLCCTTSYSIDNVMYAPLAAVPEPGSWALMAAGLLGLAGLARRQRFGAAS